MPSSKREADALREIAIEEAFASCSTLDSETGVATDVDGAQFHLELIRRGYLVMKL